MKQFRKTAKTITGSSYLKTIGKTHPYKVIMYLIISVSNLVFAYLSIRFILFLIAADGEFYIKLPRFFSVSTLLFLSTAIFSLRIIDSYRQENILRIRRYISYILLIGLFYFLSQSISWIELLKQKELTEIQNMVVQYFYLFSTIHVLFVMAGVVLGVVVYFRSITNEGDEIKELIYHTNPFERTLLEIFVEYWHFTGIVWMILYFMFLFLF